VPTVQGGIPIAKFWSLTLETVRPRLLDANLIGNEEINQPNVCWPIPNSSISDQAS
jgi:hypothetical protein